nr:FeoB-associated Cys-rich membrane protein [uncultured Desulfobacter sp.]
MGNIIVGLIVAVALFYLIRRMIKTFKGESSCGCGGTCSCQGCTPGFQESCCSAIEDSDTDRTDIT